MAVLVAAELHQARAVDAARLILSPGFTQLSTSISDDVGHGGINVYPMVKGEHVSISQLPHTPTHARGTEQMDHPRRAQDEPSIALVRDDVYAVLDDRVTMGFVERVANVYVALSGSRQIKAVEVGQSLSWDVAVEMVCRSHRRHRAQA